MNRTFRARLAALEALEAQHQAAELPVFVCLHALDAAALDDVATLPEVRAAIVAGYQIGGRQQKLYSGLCTCSWDDPPASCRVCGDRPLVGELEQHLH